MKGLQGLVRDLTGAKRESGLTHSRELKVTRGTLRESTFSERRKQGVDKERDKERQSEKQSRGEETQGTNCH